VERETYCFGAGTTRLMPLHRTPGLPATGRPGLSRLRRGGGGDLVAVAAAAAGGGEGRESPISGPSCLAMLRCMGSAAHRVPSTGARAPARRGGDGRRGRRPHGPASPRPRVPAALTQTRGQAAQSAAARNAGAAQQRRPAPLPSLLIVLRQPRGRRRRHRLARSSCDAALGGPLPARARVSPAKAAAGSHITCSPSSSCQWEPGPPPAHAQAPRPGAARRWPRRAKYLGAPGPRADRTPGCGADARGTARSLAVTGWTQCAPVCWG
jgi:hypothetical protein